MTKISELKSRKMLWSFIDYCVCHKEERFWQALRNWSGYAFIWGSHIFPDPDSGAEWIEACLEDTFYKENKEDK